MSALEDLPCLSRMFLLFRPPFAETCREICTESRAFCPTHQSRFWHCALAISPDVRYVAPGARSACGTYNANAHGKWKGGTYTSNLWRSLYSPEQIVTASLDSSRESDNTYTRMLEGHNVCLAPYLSDT
jgi:hypothetical protein